MITKLNEQVIKTQLQAYKISDIFSGEIYVFDSVTSTNLLAKDFASKNCTECVFIAEHQTQGRGRLGRNFFSPEGTGLYMSLVFSPSERIENPSLVTASAAVGVCRALKSECNADAQIKWVNDIFLKGKKICGILTEGILDEKKGGIGSAVIGIGVNIAESSEGFPEEIASVAGSVFGKTCEVIDKNKIASAIIFEVYNAVKSTFAGDKSAIKEYSHRSIFIAGQKLTVFPVACSTEQSYEASYVGIDEQAHLIVEKSDGMRVALNSGEVTLRSSLQID